MYLPNTPLILVKTEEKVIKHSTWEHIQTDITVGGRIPKGLKPVVYLEPSDENAQNILPGMHGVWNCCCTIQIVGFYASVYHIDVHFTETLKDHIDYSIVIPDQAAKKYKAVLEKHGFVKIRRWHNRLHGPSILNLYIRGFVDEKPLPLED